MSQQDPDPYAVMAQVLITLALITAAVVVVVVLSALIAYVVHRTADSASRRPVAVLTAIISIMSVVPAVLYPLSRIYGW